MSGFKTETVEGIENFNKRIKELESQKPKPNVIVVFKGSNEPGTNETWCSDCLKFGEIFPKNLASKIPSSSIILYVLIGSKEDWKNPQNPFRVDKRMKLTSVPTIMIWKTPKRLSGTQIFEENLLALLFEED